MSQPIRRPDGSWRQVIELPRGVDGKRRRKDVEAKTKPALIAKVREIKQQIAREGDMRMNTPTVEAWVNYWLENVKAKDLKPRTWMEYRRKSNLYIIPSVGRYRLDALTPAHVRGLHEYVERTLGLSPTTALQAHRILAKSLTDAEREGHVFRNVARLVDAPKKDAVEIQAMNADEARHLLRSVAGDRALALRLGVALLAGLRQGEALGLHWSDVDIERGIITVRWQLQRLPGDMKPPRGHESKHLRGGLWLLRPKSKAGWREVPIAPILMPLFVKPAGGTGELVFGGMDPRRDARRWEDALKAAGLPHYSLHSARHSTATLLAALGVSERVRMAILGHSSATVTLGYTHTSNDEAVAAIGQLNQLMEG